MTVDHPGELPADLRAAISADLRALTPLPRPVARLVWLPPGGVLAPFLGGRGVWRRGESVPGTTLPRRVVGMIFGSALILVLTVTWMTWAASPTVVAPGFIAYV